MVWCGVWHLAEDAFDVGTEPDVEHPVGLVEDDVENISHVERAPLDMVEHPAGRADHQVDPPAQGFELALDRLAAVDPANRHITCMGKLLQLTNDLLSQLARGGQNNALRAARPALQHLNQRNAKGRRLAGAGLGLPDDIQAIERLRDEVRLDRGGCGVTGMCQGLEHHRAQTHRMESRSGFLLGSSIQTILQKCQSCGDKWVVATKAARPLNFVKLVLDCSLSYQFTRFRQRHYVASRMLWREQAGLTFCEPASDEERETGDLEHFLSLPAGQSSCSRRVLRR